MEILVRDAMVRDVAYVSLPGTRDKVLRVLNERHVSGVPVVKNCTVVGMVTRTDLLRNPEEDQIAMLMTRNPYVVRPEDRLVDAAKLFVEKHVRRLPVVEDGRLVGIISVADIVRVIATLSIDETIDRYFERNVVAVWSEMPLPVVGAIMEYAGVQACPVIDTDLQLVGIVTDRDLIAKSVVEESLERADADTAPEMDEWSWESQKEAISRYYQVSKIKLKNVKVREAMVQPIIALRSSRVSECARIMSQKRIDQMPVVNAHRKLIGMLNDHNLLVPFISAYGK
ncbi:MAG: CBS domain-containing protein [Methanothrix sp.]|uniref:CBS domain-containing protein n=1 Tax=Methanothrix sp. TaxID=90426 RepID=UPI0031698F47|nr:CBS domain-containing protein [Methanothrix sp.]